MITNLHALVWHDTRHGQNTTYIIHRNHQILSLPVTCLVIVGRMESPGHRLGRHWRPQGDREFCFCICEVSPLPCPVVPRSPLLSTWILQAHVSICQVGHIHSAFVLVLCQTPCAHHKCEHLFTNPSFLFLLIGHHRIQPEIGIQYNAM